MIGVVIPVALGAAVCFGWSTAAMHHDASTAPVDIRGPFALIRHLSHQWRWLTGMAASLAGLGLHAWALSLGSLAVVQPLVVTGLVAALLFRSALDRCWPSRAELGWGCVTAVGLAVFLVAAPPSTGTAAAAGGPAAIIIIISAVTACLCWRAARHSRQSRAGLLLGLGTGINFGLTAGTLKAASAAHSLGGLLTGWPLYTLIGLGACGMVANQVTYRRASLARSLPALNVANPVVALIFGLVAFHERPATGTVALLVEGGSLVIVLVGVFVLARLEAAPIDAELPVALPLGEPEPERLAA